MTSSNPFWDTRARDASLHDLMRIEYEELAGMEGEIGIPEELLSPPSGFGMLSRVRRRRGVARPKKYIPLSLDEIEPKIK